MVCREYSSTSGWAANWRTAVKHTAAYMRKLHSTKPDVWLWTTDMDLDIWCEINRLAKRERMGKTTIALDTSLYLKLKNTFLATTYAPFVMNHRRQTNRPIKPTEMERYSVLMVAELKLLQ